MNILKIITISTLTLSINVMLAQLPSTGVSSSNVLDGVYVKEHIPTKMVVQYTHLREADVMWSKRIWRTIDLRQKQNHPLYYPLKPLSDRMSLWDVIKYGVIEEGNLTIYDLGLDADDQFREPVKPTNGNINDPNFKLRIQSFFGVETSVPKIYQLNDPDVINGLANPGDPVTDANGLPVKFDTVVEYTTEEIVRYEIKEDWFFDKQRSVLDVRIIGIAPQVIFVNPVSENIEGFKTLFWLYFPECRYVFQNFYVYNPQNDAQRMSFDDFFWKREFSSYIKKESNIYDRDIGRTWTGIDALLESDKIKEEMFELEHDLWHF
jgi:gliding motility associated protien GldN